MDFSTERIKEYLPPVRIAESVECENLQTLLSPKDKQIYLATPADGDFFTLKKGGYIVLDFGKELHGGIRILNFRQRIVRADSFRRIVFGSVRRS